MGRRLEPVRHLPLVALLAWAAVIFTLSSFPNPPGATGGEWRYDAAHVAEYLVFGGLAFRVVRTYLAGGAVPVLAALALALSVLYGMSDEFHQSFVPNRDANWLDVGFDAVGAAIGVALGVFSIRKKRAPRSHGS